MNKVMMTNVRMKKALSFLLPILVCVGCNAPSSAAQEKAQDKAQKNDEKPAQIITQKQQPKQDELDPKKNPKNFFPSLASIAYKKNHTLSCGNSKIIDEQRLYDKLKYVTDEHVKQARFLLHVAICNDLAYNFSKAIRDAQSVVFIEDIRGQKSAEFEIALSLLATHGFVESDVQAWAYYRLRSDELVLKDGLKYSEDLNVMKIDIGVRSEIGSFLGARLDSVVWRR